MITTYTKVILTIIAICLVLGLLRPIIIPGPVVAGDIIDVNIAKVGDWIIGRRLPVEGE